MYYILLETMHGGIIGQDLPRAADPTLCMKLADERDSFFSGVQLEFLVGPSCLELDYLSVVNASSGRLCSQRFLDVLREANVPGTVYPARLLERQTHEVLSEHYSFWFPKRIPRDEVVDWERSEEEIDQETGARKLTKLAMKEDFLTSAPLLFVGAARYLIHERLRMQLEAKGITGVVFAPLDAARDPYTGVKRLELKQRLEVQPNDWSLWYELGRQSHGQEAVDAFNQTLMLNPDAEEAWYQLGRVFHKQGALQETLDALQRALALNNQSQAWGEYIDVLLELGRKEEALTKAQQWIEVWGERSPLPWYALGKVHATSGHHTETVETIERGFAVMGPVGRHIEEVQRIRGEALYHLGRYEEALAAYNIAISNSPLYRALHAGKVRVLRALGRERAATRAERELQKLEQRREENMKKRPI